MWSLVCKEAESCHGNQGPCGRNHFMVCRSCTKWGKNCVVLSQYCPLCVLWQIQRYWWLIQIDKGSCIPQLTACILYYLETVFDCIPSSPVSWCSNWLNLLLKLTECAVCLFDCLSVQSRPECGSWWCTPWAPRRSSWAGRGRITWPSVSTSSRPSSSTPSRWPLSGPPTTRSPPPPRSSHQW